MEFKGLYTAIVTPFSKNGKVDFDKLKELVDFQIANRIDGIIPVGTTGESPTLPIEDHMKVIKTVIERANGRCQIIAGTGANCTEEAIEQTKKAKKMGADATLQVTPYYNKPTQEGLYRHFSSVAEIGLPVVLYNVPGRTGTAIAVDTVARLSKNNNIPAIKEAGGSVDRVSEILSTCKITVLSGDDSLTLPMMALGAKGVISVASNYIPGHLKDMIEAFFAGNLEKAKELHYKYYKFMRDIFVETNPIPIKAAMARRGMIEEEYRLPLCPMSEKNKKLLFETMDSIGI
ncbi:MAG TPA: 4-hydroxy-tetrahydrodipicolinate synthase [Lentisphaeria bacterium]|nr:MAG: 4-hydroxy-tetrahydrodipicolinate synthase [Lentisphaerae bacterium GWF2_38_69]HBM15040.1 4-hydroxy-tetrahydrodipicolinate synthase [Lentisphaeria bacterium]